MTVWPQFSAKKDTAPRPTDRSARLRSYVEAIGGELDLVVRLPTHRAMRLRRLGDMLKWTAKPASHRRITRSARNPASAWRERPKLLTRGMLLVRGREALGARESASLPLLHRREFITLLGGAAAWPISARGQQTAVPVVGFLDIAAAVSDAPYVAAFKQGLSETGYVEGKNVAIESRFTENQFDRLPALAADLVRRRPAVIYAIGPPSVRALKAQSATIPVIFRMGEDPVKEGFVASLNRPGGNVTGVTHFTNQLFPKRLQLFQEIVPKAAALALLVNPDNPNAEPDSEDARAAATALGRELLVVTAKTGRGIEQAFVTLVQRRVGGLIVGVDGLFFDRRDQVFA